MKLSGIITILLLTSYGCHLRQKEVESDGLDRIFKPAYHFAPPSHWMNDPNGMVYFEGEYHLFYQHYPEGLRWGPMHWGHAVSSDMVHWEHLPIALYPDSLGYIFSGSCVIDWENTSGFGKDGEPPMVAIFTHSFRDEQGIPQKQSIAYSLDNGRTWVKYEGNPVIDEGLMAFRDPKVFWHDASESWIMSLAATTDNVGIRPDHIRFYASDDLKSWKYLSEFGHNIGSQDGKWECPDLLKLKSEGQDQEKWVLLVSINLGGPNGGSATQYFVGDFDGREFTSEDTVTRWIDYGTDNYAGVTWSGIPTADSRILTIGWMNNWNYANEIPESGSRGATTIPRMLTLKKNVLVSSPVEEIKSLRKQKVNLQLTEKAIDLQSPYVELVLTLKSERETPLRLVLLNSLNEQFQITLDMDSMTIDRGLSGKNTFSEKFNALLKSPLPSQVQSIRIFVDRTSVEVFINDGEVVSTQLAFPTVPYEQVRFEEGVSTISDAVYFTLEPIWELTQ